jgi:hypothetical protein
MILPDDVDEKVEFWVGESDTESENESDGGMSTIEGARPWKTTNLIDPRLLRNKVRSEKGSGSTNNKSGSGAGRRRVGNGLLAVQSESRGNSRNQHAFELKLGMRRVTRSEDGRGTPPIAGVRRNPTEKGSRWRTIGGLPDTVCATVHGFHQIADEWFAGQRAYAFAFPRIDTHSTHSQHYESGWA